VVKVIDGDRGGSVPSTAFPIGPEGNRRCTEARSLTDVLLSAEGDRGQPAPFLTPFQTRNADSQTKGTKAVLYNINQGMVVSPFGSPLHYLCQ